MKVLLNSFHLNGHTLGFNTDFKVKTIDTMICITLTQQDPGFLHCDHAILSHSLLSDCPKV